MKELRDWQNESLKKIRRCNSDAGHDVIPVNACVGSGKTMLAALAFGDFIERHFEEKTVQMFVTPRIKLCKQQLSELAGKIKDRYPSQDFGGSSPDFQLIPVDCRHDDYNKRNPTLGARHVIFVVCDASLWGEDKNEPGLRWNGWKSNFDAWTAQGYVFGNVAFDEAHNYKNSDKVEKMFGQTVFEKDHGIAWETGRSIIHWFKNVMLLSGTPAAFQKELSRAYPKNTCECPVNLAVKASWICSPVLNLVRHGSDGAEKIYSNAVVQVLKHEQEKVKPANGIRMLVNFQSIDEIKYFLEDPYIKQNTRKLFHVYTIHSQKTFEDGSPWSGATLKSTVDGKEMDSEDIYDYLCGNDEKQIKGIDETEFGLPVIVCQVAMIGEGINISSFNSVITASSSEMTAMQQIGRVLRLFSGKQEPNVYCLYDNLDSLETLYCNLRDEHSLTADCFSWGDKIDLQTGSSMTEQEEKDMADPAVPEWIKINPDFDAEIQKIDDSLSSHSKAYNKNLMVFSDSDAYNEIAKCLKSFPAELLKKFIGKIKAGDETSRQFGKAGISTTRKAKTPLNALAVQSTAGEASTSIPQPVQAEQTLSTEFQAYAETAGGEPPVSASQPMPAGQMPVAGFPAPVDQEPEPAKTAPSEDLIRKLIENLVRPVGTFVYEHRKQKAILDRARRHLTALTDYIFSWNVDLAKAIKDSNICQNEAFRKAVGL